MRRVLITGASGFIGSCLARRFLERGDEVHILLRETSSTWRLEEVLGQMAIHQADLRDSVQVTQCVNQVRPDVIIHAAAHGGFSWQTDDDAIQSANAKGTANLLDACLQSGFSKFINTGSSSEYGEKSAPMREDDELAPEGAYGASKAAAMHYCRHQAEKHAAAVATLRLFSPFGPWDDPSRLVPYVIRSLLAGRNPQLSTPTSVRDYIFVEDVLDAYECALACDIRPGAVYNVGSGRQHSIGEVVAEIAGIIGGEAGPQWGSVASARKEPSRWQADISLAEQELGWQPRTSLAQGLEQTVAWMQDNVKYYQRGATL